MKLFKVLPYLGLFAIFIASFGDEVSTITFSFGKIDDESMMKLSLLMTCPMLGGVLSAPLSITLLNRFKPRTLLALIFLTCGTTCVLAASAKFALLDYLACFVLGGLGTMFWSTFSVLIANCFREDEFAGINGLTQSIRSAGYIVAPMIAGFVSGNFSGAFTLLAVAMVFFLSILFVPTLFKGRDHETFSEPSGPNRFQVPNVLELLKIPKMASTLPFLAITILTTSVFNVAFIHYILVDRSMSKMDYGLIVSGISIGLVIGPLFLRLLRKRAPQHGVVACFAASTIGLCVTLSGFFAHVVPLFGALLLLGIANSIQNTSMSTLTMLVIPKDRRNSLMPTYIFIVQTSVLTGFLVAGLIPTRYSALVLIFGGALASLAGLTGALLNTNLNGRTQPCSA